MLWPMDLLLLFLAGIAAGTLNIIAGGGSFLTLPLLIFFGLPAGVANATNRVGILLQNVTAVWSFDRHGVLDRGSFAWAVLPSLPGGLLGTLLALVVSDVAFKRVLVVLMVLFALYALKKPPRPEAENVVAERGSKQRWLLAAGFFGAGVYAGFVQAGVGFLFIALVSAAGLDLVRGNAVKVFAILFLTALSLGIFAWQGQVDWRYGLAMGASNLFGGIWGARLTVLKGHDWVRRVVLVAVLVFAVKLGIDSFTGS